MMIMMIMSTLHKTLALVQDQGQRKENIISDNNAPDLARLRQNHVSDLDRGLVRDQDHRGGNPGPIDQDPGRDRGTLSRRQIGANLEDVFDQDLALHRLSQGIVLVNSNRINNIASKSYLPKKYREAKIKI